jgi:hypothetical protein
VGRSPYGVNRQTRSGSPRKYMGRPTLSWDSTAALSEDASEARLFAQPLTLTVGEAWCAGR